MTRHTHVLIIDDVPQDLGSLVLALRNQCWQVGICTDGRQGFYRAQAVRPDLILLDVRMPDMDGFATCRLLNASPQTRNIPIIFLTAVGDDEDRLRGLQDGGGVDYIVKPCLPAEVVARIRIHLRRTATTVVATTSEADTGAILSQDEVILRAAMRLISQNLEALPPLQEIAQQVGTHDKRLSVVFREHLGLTVFAWVREERLRVAREWLADSDMSIQDIASQVGFHSAANFATSFRKRMGVTPSQYRESLEGSRNSQSHVD